MDTISYTRPVSAGRSADAYCAECDAPMTGDEAALNYKLVSKSATHLLCPVCLGRLTGESPEHFRKMILLFRKQGCTLFTPWTEEQSTLLENKEK